jgi:hypothetical protein
MRFALLRWNSRERATYFERWVEAESAPHAMVKAMRAGHCKPHPSAFFARSETGPASYLTVPNLRNPEAAL